MATAPVKSQPLHNFSLPFLKWGKNQSSNHHHHNHHRKHSPSSLHHHHNHNHNRSSASEPDSDGTASSQKDHYGGSRSTSKNLLIRFPKPPPTTTTTGTGISTVKPVPTPDEEDSFPAAKPWNLRPRKTLIKAEIGGSAKSIHHNHISSDFDVPEKLDKEGSGPGPAPAPGLGPGPGSGPKSMRLKAFAEAAQTVDKKDKSKLLVSLSREEIEEDFFVMTGSKPHRRPRKRPRCVQKQVDNLCPGLWLAGMTPESYNLPDFLLK